MKKVKVIINEQHRLLEEQKKILEKTYKNYELVKVPAQGWTLQEMDEKIEELEGCTMVFVSPIPYMIMKLSYMEGYAQEEHCIAQGGPLIGYGTEVKVFHNDKREKKELPNGKVINVIANTGWQLI